MEYNNVHKKVYLGDTDQIIISKERLNEQFLWSKMMTVYKIA